MNILIRYIFVSLLTIIFIGCSEDEMKPQPDTKNRAENTVKEIEEENQAVQIDEMKVNEGVNKIDRHSTIEPESKSELIEPEELEKFLPKTVKYFQTIPANYGSSHDGVIFTSVIGEYVGTKGGYFSIAIFDYGKGNNFPDKPYFDTLPIDPGFEAKRLDSKYGPAYTLWHDVELAGKLRLYANDRYYIKIDVTYLSPSIMKMENILKEIDIEGLIKLK